MSTRKEKEEQPVLAICYDFDKTLSPDDMQAQGYIQKVYGDDVQSFWKESNALAEDNEMDSNLAYMFKMKEEAEGKELFTRKKLEDYGSRVSLFPGVSEWFERIREFGKIKGVIVEHYIISSGLKEMIEGTAVAKAGAFEKIYASSFFYNKKGVAIWPAQVINYTNKTQFLFRIEKGVLDINDYGVNDYFAPEDIRVPFRNIVYIGDSDTDIPCMKLVNTYGGHSIGVYNEKNDKSKVYKMMRENRIKYFAPADYTDGSEIDIIVKSIINRTASNELLESIHYKCKEEQETIDSEINQDKIKLEKLGLIMSLESSGNFFTTHRLIEKLVKYQSWSEDEIQMLIDAALNNTQVRYIINDPDVKSFYKKVLASSSTQNNNSKELKELFE